MVGWDRGAAGWAFVCSAQHPPSPHIHLLHHHMDHLNGLSPTSLEIEVESKEKQCLTQSLQNPTSPFLLMKVLQLDITIGKFWSSVLSWPWGKKRSIISTEQKFCNNIATWGKRNDLWMKTAPRALIYVCSKSEHHLRCFHGFSCRFVPEQATWAAAGRVGAWCIESDTCHCPAWGTKRLPSAACVRLPKRSSSETW